MCANKICRLWEVGKESYYTGSQDFNTIDSMDYNEGLKIIKMKNIQAQV
jgi:hypothetical protein